MRLDKFLSDMGVASRAELKKEIRAGLIVVDREIVRDPGFHVPENAKICRKGIPVRYESFVYYMLNKPAGVISATEDKKQPTVLDLLPKERRKGIAPVGRLDKDTVGLLLLTNDGDLAHRLLSPKHHVDKVYFVRVRGKLTNADVQAFAEGLRISEDFLCLPAKLEVLRTDLTELPQKTADLTGSSERHDFSAKPESLLADIAEFPLKISEQPESSSAQRDGVLSAVPESTETASEALVTIQEGKFHQIKRMFEAVGKEVLYLKRLSMGPLTLDPDLPEGACRRLTDTELSALRKEAGISEPVE